MLASIFTRYGGYTSPETFTDGLVVATWVAGRRSRRARRAPHPGQAASRRIPSSRPRACPNSRLRSRASACGRSEVLAPPALVRSPRADRGPAPLRAARRADLPRYSGQDVRALPARRRPRRRRRRRARHPVRHRDDEPSRARFGPEAVRAASIALRPTTWRRTRRSSARSRSRTSETSRSRPGTRSGPSGRSRRRSSRSSAPERARSASEATTSSSSASFARTRPSTGRSASCARRPRGRLGRVLRRALLPRLPFRRALEEGSVDPARSLLAGMRGLRGPADAAMPSDLGFEAVPCEESSRSALPYGERARAGRRGAALPLLRRRRARPGFAPGTGTPEAGGLDAGGARLRAPCAACASPGTTSSR